MRRYRVPESKYLLVRVIIEVLAILVLVYPMLHIYVILQGNMKPYQRGFFCDDANLKHPNLEEEITVGECFLIWAAIVLLIVPAIEMLHVTVFQHEAKPQVAGVPWVVIELYRILGYFTLGALCSLLTTEMAKYKIGRLRPYFMEACGIELTDDLCKDQNGYPVFVVDYECPGNPYDVREASKSFLSGHSSFSFYCATFLIVYLHARLSNVTGRYTNEVYGRIRAVFRGLKILRPFLQFGVFSLAFYISLTRISDYKHHPADVVVGMLVGIFFAIIILLFLVDLFNRPRVFKIEELDEEHVANVVAVDVDEWDGKEDGNNIGEAERMPMTKKVMVKENRSPPASTAVHVELPMARSQQGSPA